ncbi:MAG: SDR family NAD(P)-dependent oxidoreductase [Spongiibacteraceae bacterium]
MSIPDRSNSSLPQLLSLQGRRAVITGGARGLGLAIAQRFAEAGASVALGDVLDEDASKAAAEIAQTYKVATLARRLDVSEAVSVNGLADAVVEAWGGIDIWVNNAGIFPHSSFVEMDDAEWDRVIAVNLRGAYLGAKAAVRRMPDTADKANGVVINIASMAGLRGRPQIAHYCASKHGMIGMTKSLALELGPRGIRVLCVAPGLTLTPGVQANMPTGTPPTIAPQAGGVSLGRLGVADDIARVVLFCASDLSMYMTGHTLPVDGGALAF